jgi:signal transduction histidine kinase
MGRVAIRFGPAMLGLSITCSFSLPIQLPRPHPLAQRFQLLIRDRHGFERTVPLGRSITLGRQSLCDVVLSDSMISRNHLRLENHEGRWFAEDLGSTHGSFYKEQPLGRMEWDPGSPLRLADGAYTLTLLSQIQTTSELHLQAILETAQLMAQDVDLEDLLEQTLDRLLDISGTDRGFIMLLEEGELQIKAQRNLGKEPEGAIQLSMSSVHSVFENGDPIWILNVADDEKLSSQQSILRLELKTILCLPLTLQGRRIGVVYLDSRRPITEPVSQESFQAIVSLCAIAIERTRMSEQNLRSEVLATVGQVASSIVHDFKNGLFVLRGHAELLELASSDPRVKHHAEKIRDSVVRLTTLSHDILEYAKVQEPKRSAVELKSYLEGIIEPYMPRAAESGGYLAVEGDAVQIQLDPERFTRVVENLVANALDALDKPQGSVILSIRRVTGGAQVKVTDNGKGIPKKVLKRIFEPFFSFGKKKGTGLGMATVRKIIEEHGGTLEVLSEEGKGTEVILTLLEHPMNSAKTGGTDTGKHPTTPTPQVGK